MKKISLIISTYNRHDALDLVLLSVSKQVLGVDLSYDDVEVIVADDGSDYRTADVVTKYKKLIKFDLVHVWHEDKGFRLAAIRNLAISQSCGEYLLFIDGDCIIAADFILNQYLLSAYKCFVGGNRVLLSKKYTEQIIANKDISIVGSGIFGSIYARILGYTNKVMHCFRFGFNAKWRNRHPLNWRRPKGCNMAVWRDDLYSVNGFDESFVGWGHEDADFLIRIIHSGVTIKDGRFAVPVYHLWHKTSDRSNEVKNIEIVNVRVQDKTCIKASKGLDKYL